MADATVKTYGPGGRNVAIEYEGGDPKITKDGVTVVKSIYFSDREVEIGAKLLKKIAGNTNMYTGDGTTLSTYFAKSLLDKGIKAIDNGSHPILLKKGFEKSKAELLTILDWMKIPIETKEELLSVCRVSANYNEEIAQITSEALHTVGING